MLHDHVRLLQEPADHGEEAVVGRRAPAGGDDGKYALPSMLGLGGVLACESPAVRLPVAVR